MYNILHIPSGHFLELAVSSEVWGFVKEPKIAVFKSKASAGHAIEEYRLGKKPTKKRVYGQGYSFLLKEDYTIIVGWRSNKEVKQLAFSTDYSTRMNRIEILRPTSLRKVWNPDMREVFLKRLGVVIPSKIEFLIMEIQ